MIVTCSHTRFVWQRICGAHAWINQVARTILGPSSNTLVLNSMCNIHVDVHILEATADSNHGQVCVRRLHRIL